ncbi:MAG: hypothetical protein AB7F50_02810 [Fimbriimonadaceae bacterium]
MAVLDPEFNPCRHVRAELIRIAEGRSRRRCIWSWYVRLHAIRCPRCRAALNALRRYFDLVRKASPAVTVGIDWGRMTSALDEAESEHKPPSG